VHEFRRLWGDTGVDLDQAGGRLFVDALLDGEPNRLGEGFRDRLAGHTGGHALFTIELLRTFQERGDLAQDEEGRWVEGPDLRWEGLPPRVEAVIAERVGRLPQEGRRLLEAASVEGESFSAEVAARALGAEPLWAVQWLSGPLSVESRLVQALGIQSVSPVFQPLSRYRFAHTLFQEYLYGRLDAVDRAHLHGEVGAALEGLCRGDEAAFAQASPQLARHYEEAGQVLEAARYRLEAGRQASRLVAFEEAIAHFERGLALLEGVAASPERLRLELRLCMAIGTPAMLQRGWQAPISKWALERLSELTQHAALQDDPQCVTALSVLALSTSWSADPERSAKVGERLLSLARSAGSGQAQDGDRQCLMLAHWALGQSHWLRGQFVPAREHLGQAVALYDPEFNRPLGGLTAADPGVMAHAMSGAVLWQLGHPDQARASLRQAVTLAQSLDLPASLAFAHWMAAMVTSLVGRDVAAALSHCQALQSLGQSNVVYGVWAEVLWALGQARGRPSIPEAEPEQILARAMAALATHESAGSGAGYAGLLILLAWLFAGIGRAEMGVDPVDRAQAWIERTGIRTLEAEAWRMRGELLLALTSGPSPKGREQEAEACFLRALEVAREQGGRWWELGAAVSLARLWGAQGRRSEARELLAGIYGWFTEGFDTPDLVEARALLAELA
jgi:tetratricopeptide (TPR) repeat protein